MFGSERYVINLCGGGKVSYVIIIMTMIRMAIPDSNNDLQLKNNIQISHLTL